MKSLPVFLAFVAALGPLFGAGTTAPAMAEMSAAFAPPSTPFILSRTVIRDLSDGKQIIVKRSFRVQFVASGDGYLLTGAPVSVMVDVPPVLARMADIELQRSEPGPFPLAVDSRGLIRNEDGQRNPDLQAREQARQLGGSMLQAAPIPDQTKRDTIQMLGNMAADMRNSPWPVDLFTAREAERHLHRKVALADGSEGEVDVILRVQKWLPCGMPAQFERIITTDLGGTRRVSREVWGLEPASAS